MAEAGVEIVVTNDQPPAAKKQRVPPSKVCAMCTNNEAKYTCPKCAARTCSLNCVNLHKTQTGCTGQRDRAAYVPLKQMNTGHLISDMRFLEEIETSSGGASRHLVEVVGKHAHQADKSRKRPRPSSNSSSSSSSSSSTSSTNPATAQFHSTKNPLTGGGPMAPSALVQKKSRREKLLATAAKGRGIDLVLLSMGMQRRAGNTSTYQKKLDRLNWQIEWVYKDCTETTENNDENKTLHELLQKVKTLHPKKTTESNEEEPTTESEQYIYLMRKAKCPANDQRYYHLGHGNVALKELLQGKSIVEYPVVHVVPTENEDNYLKMHSIALFETSVAKETKNE